MRVATLSTLTVTALVALSVVYGDGYGFGDFGSGYGGGATYVPYYGYGSIGGGGGFDSWIRKYYDSTKKM